ncbi:asparaginase [Pseudobacteriovorax antillogorgiicola]|uniref:Asparaginase n=2 Tax=Pseudobacteriovorax antillogorgiicola TaxID=1513793 RepID=A0A1Y6C0U4_9BACT|nr:asparaginase [Pseudobacteriovorax antillogorgiicola]SMF36118.1 asparaginase [Pseudobacteriovorax antillogorgiicola]
MIVNGSHSEAFYLLHGGAGPMDPSKPWVHKATSALIELGKILEMKPYQSGIDFITEGLMLLEDHPEFNAGLGSALQADGQARLTTSVMSGPQQSFSAVMSLEGIRHPSKLARRLQEKSSRVLTAPGHQRLAQELALPFENLVVPKRLDAWLKDIREAMPDHDTVGCVLYHPRDGVFAGSSTGGRGFETPGRISDSGTVAGNYASRFAAVTVTGIGEEIVDDAVAARLESRVRDGMSLEEAGQKTYHEAKALQRSYGWVATDHHGCWQVAYTSQAMTFLGRSLVGDHLIDSMVAFD